MNNNEILLSVGFFVRNFIVVVVDFAEYTSIQIPNEMVTVETPLPIDMKPIPLVRINSFDGKDNGDKLNTPIVVTGKPAPINATVYSVGDLQMATGSFSIENLVGEGYIGRVYRAQFDDGKVF